ncbi:MAG: RimK family alpha-L-glutamate ligase [Tissierellaceae bacterium]
MKGWIIYNGALRIKKVEILVEKLSLEGKKKDIDLKLVKNNQLIPTYNSLGKAELNSIVELDEPDFIIFWDKDILLARHLEKMGYKLFNKREAIENCDNKALMHLKLSNLNIRIPKTIVGPFVFHQQNLKEQYYNVIFEELGNKIILKESYGSFGMQVYLINRKEELQSKLIEMGNRSFILQEYIDTSFGKDIRVNIVGDRIIGAMERTNSSDFRANITLGGVGKVVELDDRQKEIALAAHKALELDFSGVDLLYGKENEPILCEVNSNVNYVSFETASGLNFSSILLDYIMERL